MADKASGTEDTVAAPPNLAHGTTRGSDPVVPQPTSPKPAGTVTRASSPSLERSPSNHDAGDYETLQEVDPALYTIVTEIARGGMGRILEVRDRRLGRSVAIKEVLHADDATLARFEREVRITARLQHPAIVHVHEAGIWPNGKPFYVMKLIRGKPLDVRIGMAKSLAQRLELLPAVTTVVDALAYAHSQRVIHRDLKPANVLVGDFGETIVIDWGIAKELGETAEIVSIPIEKPTNSTETVAGSVIGTPSYMPPEQAAGEKVDARADVYSLGALLYQLLAGVPPFVGRTTAEVLSKVIDSDPEPLAAINEDIPADLIAIVEKAMAKEPRDRFPTANEMAIELKRFQQGKLVESHRYTKWELARRWLRRYRLPVAIAGVMLVVLLVGAGFSFAKIMAERDRADAERREAMISSDHGKLALAELALETDPTRALAILKTLSPHSPEWGNARAIATEAAERGVADVIVESGDTIFGMTFSPSGHLLAEHGSAGLIRIWDLRTNLARIYGPPSQLYGFGFADEDHVISFDFDGKLWRYDITTGARTLIRALPEPEEIAEARLSPDATRMLVLDRSRTARLVDVAATGERVIGTYHRGSWSDDGQYLLLVNRTSPGKVERYTVADGTITPVLSDSDGEAVTDGKRTWTSSWNTRFLHSIVSDAANGIQHVIPEHIHRMVMLPDGGVVVTGVALTNADGAVNGNEHGTLVSIDPKHLAVSTHAVRVYSPSNDEPLTLAGHTVAVEGVAVARDGTIATGDYHGEIRIWHLPTISHHPSTRRAANRAFLSSDHRYLAVSRRGPQFDLHDLVAGTVRTITASYPDGYQRDIGEGTFNTTASGLMIHEQFDEASTEVLDLASSAGTRFATVDENHRLVIWDVATGRGTFLADHVVRAAINPAGTHVVTVSDHGLQLWDLATRAATTLHDKIIETTALSINATNVVLVSVDSFNRVLAFVPGRPPLPLYSPTFSMYRSFAIMADGRHAAGGSDDGVIRVWNLDNEDDHQEWMGPAGSVIALAFSPDESRLAVSSADNKVRVLTLADGSMTVCKSKQSNLAPTLRYEDEHTLISSSLDHAARICDPSNGLSHTLAGAPVEVVFAAHVSAGRVITVDRFGQLAEHADNLPYGEPLLRAWLDSATNVLR